MNKSQQRGFILLTVILLSLVAVMILVQPKATDSQPICDTLAAYEDSLVARYERKQEERRQAYQARKAPRSHSHYQTHSNTYPSSDDTPSRINDHRQRDTLTHTHTYRPRPMLVFDLNEADTTDLKQLYGIGSVFARRIVRYREQLGGYMRKEQLMEVYGMTDTLYHLIAPHLSLDHPVVRPLNINTATLDELKRHPYLDYYKAKAIVQYRTKVGPFHQTQDLLKVTQIDPETYNQLQPYIAL